MMFKNVRSYFLIKAEQVDVTVIGNNWNEANAAAEDAVRTREGVFMVHPFGQVSDTYTDGTWHLVTRRQPGRVTAAWSPS